MNSIRAGMQVHAVPDDERATDATGKPLPWAYSYADSSLNRKQLVERGPFGRPTSRRATSRTKTATPGPREDPIVAENMKTFDEIFGRQRKEREDTEVKPVSQPRPPTSRIPQTQSAMDLASPNKGQSQGSQAAGFREPTEIMIYGYGLDRQGSAIAAFETICEGHIYEDYDRGPTTARYNHLYSSNIRASILRNFPRDAIRKINTYQGGDHWIKVTLDSSQAAERALQSSPHTIEGYDVYAEYWRGVGPSEDVALPVGASRSNTLNQRRPSQPRQRRPFSTMPSRLQSAPDFGSVGNIIEESPETTETLPSESPTGKASGNDAQMDQQALQRQPQEKVQVERPLRIRGATRAVLRPASEALLPVPPWSQRTFGHIPLLGSLFGGDPNAKPGQGGGIIGNSVPLKDDGTLDWTTASTYWKLCWYVDSWLGTDLCGVKGG